MVKEKVISEESLKKTKKWTKSIVKQWHSKDPDYVFLTETSAVLYGYPLKEAWRKAYPDEKVPEFYRLDPDALWYRIGESKEIKGSDLITEEKKYFDNRIKKKDPTIIVFDEGSNEHAKTMEDFSLYSKDNKLNKKYIFRRDFDTQQSVSVVAEFIYDFLNDNNRGGEIYASRQGNEIIRKGSIGDDQQSKLSKNPTSKFSGARSKRPMSQDEDYQYDEKQTGFYGKLTGAIVKHPEQRKRAMDYVKELKDIGKDAGEEIAKQRGLEKKLASIIGISALALSLIFLQSNITGNAIANLTTKTSSIIGASLFVLGIIGSYFYFKKK